MPKPNLKIPLILIQKYKLSPLAILLYGELNGLYSKYHMCNITDIGIRINGLSLILDTRMLRPL